MRILKVKTKPIYNVYITDGALKIKETLSPLISGEKTAVLYDENTFGLYGKFLSQTFNDKKLFSYVIKAGENSKNAENYFSLLNKLAIDGFTRKDTLIAFGGGVVGDLGAFVASTYMRGIKLIAMPTTLLAMVDSSVGGKTAINLDKGKNLCGTFYQPSAVFINTEFLKTLPEREIKCGLGEILKYRYLSKKPSDITVDNIDEKLIYNCLKIKAGIVSKDEKEKNERKLLNFGHTFGHAIEKASLFSLSHGECVAKGISFAIKLSYKYFGYNNDFLTEYEKLALSCGVDISCDFNVKELLKIAYSDKKRNGDKIDFVLINKKKKPVIVPISIEKAEKLLCE